MARLTFLLLLGLLAGSAPTFAAGPEPILLWPNGAPGAVGEEPLDRPEIRIYQPPQETANGTGVVICPGGGYGALATDHEGHQVAKWFNTFGVTAVVLKYRLAPRYRHPAPLQDAQRAVRYVRSHAESLNLSKRRIGIMGFSAGGHLASTVATHFDSGAADSDDPIERVSCRPDFVILGYPVISFSEFGHRGSARNLLGDNPDPELVRNLSNETQVTPQSPPAFLFHTGEDAGVPVENSLAYYAACRKAGVPAELHIYAFGPHGVGLAPGDPVLNSWKDRLRDWLQTSGLLIDAERAAVAGEVIINGDPIRWGNITFIPKDNPHAPVAWGRISRGKYTIAAQHGPILGSHRIEIRDMGDVVPYPTRDDVRVTTRDPGTGEELKIDIQPGVNTLNFNLQLDDR